MKKEFWKQWRVDAIETQEKYKLSLPSTLGKSPWSG